MFSVERCWTVRLMPNFFYIVTLLSWKQIVASLLINHLLVLQARGEREVVWRTQTNQSWRVRQLASKQGWYNSSLNVAGKYCMFCLNGQF